jgi:hypothetical protein
MPTYKLIPEYRDVSSQQFFDDIVPQQQPVVLRGFAQHWPLVQAAQQSPREFAAYLARYYNGAKTLISVAPPSAKKRFYYNSDMTGVDFVTGEERVDLFLGRLLELIGRETPPAISMQSCPVNKILPGLAAENASDFFTHTEPRLWAGNEGVVDTHFDNSDNVACAVAGRRRFILFPPNQTDNLYPGPFEFTPAGVPVSLVNLLEPDFERHPRFKTALASAYSAELEPGDAIFIPMLWWHHVESLSRVNALINYWWNGPFAQDATTPTFIDSLKLSALAMRDLSPKQRDAWRCMFDHYVFKQGVDPASYIPKHQQYVLGDLSPSYVRAIKDHFVQKLKN